MELQEPKQKHPTETETEEELREEMKTNPVCDTCGGPHKTSRHELFGDTEKLKENK
ncbi:MAG: hypothetical protein UW79_C0008G0033 [Candidatus Yanofskybacteria bacterium GW2011_GWA2_44_9]|uniref:Uncharacterized protein n=1 Tax=Candidatus Yanofskybacteria bacterium GW2011_GWA2_44_9 TaxID=1619025 RepID=A0A0G1NDU1_9BACT|nr:MAG: hypothetical protein UW79_C0008G0033 [Candidatus Yanofskybacteria bacterium GW2011_GWA2_44_9]